MDVNGVIGRPVQRIAGSKRFAPIAKHVVPRVDRVLSKATGGRFILSRLLVPSLVLTAKGAKSGIERTTPLACRPEDDGSFLVVGSNFGQQGHPAWTHNLITNPDISLVHHGRRTQAVAHLLTTEEKAEAWPRLIEVWPVYDRYVELSGGRDLRVFRLVPTA